MNMEQFLKDRDEALLSMDKDKILAYAKKYQVVFFDSVNDDTVFWGAVHKARTAVKSLPDAEREKSRLWLRKHKMQPWG